MTTIILIVHVVIALLLIGVVLVQRGQGADMGVSFGGGGAQTLFGSRGSGSFLGKMTGVLAAGFMATSLTLAFFTQQETGSVVEQSVVTESLPAADDATPDARQGGGLADALKDDTADDGLPAAE